MAAAEGIVTQGALSRCLLVDDGLARPAERTEFVISRPPLYFCPLTNNEKEGNRGRIIVIPFGKR